MAHRSRFPLAAALAATFLVAAGCASAPRALPVNELALAGPTFGAQSLRPTACYSGEHRVFFGVGLVDEERGLEARVVIDPLRGPVVRILAREHEEPSILLAKKSCRTFVAEVERTGSWTNGVNAVKTRLELDCRGLGPGRHDRVRGTLLVESCQ